MKHSLAALALLLSATLTLATAEADQTADREAIDELMWRYARALDTRNAEAYAALYTEDGEFTAGTMAVRGREALRAMIENLGPIEPGSQPMYHMTADSFTEFVDETHARHHTYYLTVLGAGGGSQPSIVAAGRGVDDLVKVDGRWLIRSRNVAPGDDGN